MVLDEHARKTIEAMEEKLRPIEERIRPLEAEARKWRVTINSILELNGEAPRYAVADDVPVPVQNEQATRLRPYGRSDFFEQPLATVVAKILDDRGALNVDELYELMFSGGFNFKEASPEKAKANLKISLGKTAKFGRTSSGYYSLSQGGRRPRGTGRGGDAESGAEQGELPIDGGASASAEAVQEPEAAG